MHRLLVVVLVASCGSAAQAPSPRPSTPAPAPAPKQTATEPALPEGVPDTPAGRQLAWVLRVLGAHGKVERTEVEAHFAASFLAHVPDAQLHAVFEQLAGIELVSASGDTTGTRLEAHLKLGDDRVHAVLVVDHDLKIEGLLFQPDVGDKPTSWQQIDEQLATVAPHVYLLAAELDHDKCASLHAVEPRAELAIGSAFKLYVLLAVVDAIAAGKLAWDTEIAVRDDWKSLPSGTTQNDPAGTKLTVLQLAQRMISISDNTATDHLLYTVTRARVEAALTAGGHARPALDTPFFATRELFLFKLGMTPEDIAAYLALAPNQRRAHLDKQLAGKRPSLDGADAWKTARRISTLEWFASGEDMCRVMATLAARAKQPKVAKVLDVLAINAGIPIDKAAWPYAGFKGGSEPGVVELTWLLRRSDDRWFVLALAANSDEAGTVSEDKLVSIAGGALDLLAKHH